MEAYRDSTIDHGVWEAKGRGLAVFRCVSDEPLGSLQSLPGTAVCTPDDPFVHIATGIQRVVLKGFHERFFFQTDDLLALINRVVLPAYRAHIPLYIFTECPQSFFVAGELPFGDQKALAESLRELAREQMGALLAQMCILVPSPEAMVVGNSIPMTPIERMLAKAMDKRGLEYEAQGPIGPYFADFTLRSKEGHVLCVEADGRDFHAADRDEKRDHAMMHYWGVTQVLRFTGSRIWHSAAACAEQVNLLWQQILAVPPPMALGLSLTAPPRPPAPLPDLSPEQAKALEPLRGVVLTLAPAGSGKTRVLTRRVVEAVRAGIAPERILCVVFNRGAREVMETRIHGDRNLPTVAIRTLHSLGYEITRNAPGTRYEGYRIIDDNALPGGASGLKRLYRQAIREDNIEQDRLKGHMTKPKFVPDELAEAYEQYVSIFKKTLVQIGQAMDVDNLPDFDAQQAARVALKVEEELARRHLMTFDDQIYRGVETLLSSPKARVRYQQQYDVVLVDEFQDLTPVQFLFVRLLALPYNNLFAVGDDDQMINSFAGADPRNLREFAALFIGATIHTLGENHRCAPSIVRRSANLITHNLDRFPKDIRPAQRNGQDKPEVPGAFRVHVSPTPQGEAEEVVNAIRAWHEDGVTYKSIAVLVRVKDVASLVQIALKNADIPFVPLQNAAFYNSRVGKLIGAYLNVCRCPPVARPDHLELALGTPNRFVAHEALEKICADGWDKLEDHPNVPGHAEENVHLFCRNAQRVFDYSAAGDRSSSEVLTFLIRLFGLDEHFRKEDQSNANTGVSGAGEMLAMIRQIATEHPNYEAFVDWYNEQAKQETEAGRSAKKEPDEDKVRIRTIHSCKGDEFKAVALFHVTDGILPHAQAIATTLNAPIEEERRVFYVGITRGIDRILVTSDRSRPSRFLAELEQARPMPQRITSIAEAEAVPIKTGGEKVQIPGRAEASKPATLVGAVWKFLCDLFK